MLTCAHREASLQAGCSPRDRQRELSSEPGHVSSTLFTLTLKHVGNSDAKQHMGFGPRDRFQARQSQAMLWGHTSEMGAFNEAYTETPSRPAITDEL